MSFSIDELRLERVEVQVLHHAAYAFWSLKGVLAERWAHGPTFGGYGISADQIVLQPGPDQEDRRLGAVYGLRASGINAEGPLWVPEVQRLAIAWLRDVYEVLQPKKTVESRVTLVAMHTIKNPQVVSERLRARYYHNDALRGIVPDRYDRFHAAVDWFADHAEKPASMVLGVFGPPHKGEYFAWEDEQRDSGWWLGLRLMHRRRREEGLDALPTTAEVLDTALNDYATIARSAFPSLVD